MENRSRLKRALSSPRTIALIVLVLINAVLLALKANRSVSEAISLNVSKPLALAVRSLTAALPFSLFEIVVVLAIALGVYALVKIILGLRRKERGSALRILLTVLTVILSFTAVYTLSTGFAYTREEAPLPALSPEREEAVSIARSYFEDFFSLAEKMDVGEDGRPVCPYSREELIALVSAEFERIESDFPELGATLYEGTVPVKSLVNSWFLSESSISGIYFAPTGEANVNGDMPLSQIAIACAHETAHGKGVMREDEANAISYLLALTSEDDYLRFSGFMHTYSRMAEVLYYYDREYFDSLSLPAPVQAEIVAQNEFWKSHGAFSSIARAFNDLYLRLVGYGKGVTGYVDSSLITNVGPGADGEAVYEITYSAVQKLIFSIYG